MKIWLNDLKEGDIFYQILLHNVYKCKHLGDAANPNFRMSRIKFEILNDDSLTKLINDTFGNNHEAFVNQYVYDTFEEAEAELRIQSQDELEKVLLQKISYKQKLDYLDNEEKRLRKFIEDYDKEHNKENI